MITFPCCPDIVDKAADERFRALVKQSGKDPDDLWIGDYVKYEWEHARHVLQVREGSSLAGKNALEFGCNYGAGSVVLAALGAEVAGVDVDAEMVSIARENVARFGFSPRVRLLAYEECNSLPFADHAFDIVLCNSVLEYVSPGSLKHVQCEIDRVLKPGGRIVITGTSNRLSPREIHSGRWLVNYVPKTMEEWFSKGSSWQRGIMPHLVRYGFGKDYKNLDWLDGGRAYLEARRRFGERPVVVLQLAHWLARRAGVTLGLLTPSISVTLRKPHDDR